MQVTTSCNLATMRVACTFYYDIYLYLFTNVNASCDCFDTSQYAEIKKSIDLPQKYRLEENYRHLGTEWKCHSNMIAEENNPR